MWIRRLHQQTRHWGCQCVHTVSTLMSSCSCNSWFLERLTYLTAATRPVLHTDWIQSSMKFYICNQCFFLLISLIKSTKLSLWGAKAETYWWVAGQQQTPVGLYFHDAKRTDFLCKVSPCPLCSDYWKIFNHLRHLKSYFTSRIIKQR